MTALGQDKEIKAYVISELKAHRARAENLITLIEKNLAFLEKE